MKRSEFAIALTKYICNKMYENRLEDTPSYDMLKTWITEFMLDNLLES